MNINNIGDKCLGCSACKNICPTKAITTTRSFDGFLYPEVDSVKCVDCGACNRVCPVLDDTVKPYPIHAYYGRSKDEDILAKSSSGGAFSEIAKLVLNKNGVVFGAAFDQEKKEVVITDTKHVELDKLRRSKYVESDPGESFLEVKKYLENGTLVLFVGLPCQVAGLKKFLGKDYDNLITCDFICGGSTSTINFQDHMKHLEKKYKSKVIDVNFRPKLYGWREHSFKVDFENNKSYRNYAYLDTYFRGFVVEKALIRECCNSCQFKNGHVSDIILADFWGYWQVKDLEKLDDKGMSLIMINTLKGKKYVDNINEQMSLKEIPLQYISYNFSKSPTDKHINLKKQTFLENYAKYGFEKAAKLTYMKKCVKFRIKKAVKKVLRGIFG